MNEPCPHCLGCGRLFKKVMDDSRKEVTCLYCGGQKTLVAAMARALSGERDADIRVTNWIDEQSNKT